MKPNHSTEQRAACSSPFLAQPDKAVERLEALIPGCRLWARDGTPFIRTNRTCICFCNLLTGVLCSAKDICYEYGGIDEEALGRASKEHGDDKRA
ncbi:hypothetical protein ACHMW6_25585 [Pseudoduganella sp. UC29_106]|uniref:hypothetical protein n=1 Tax=Pseudoduganella sp. UC29_106 TaxID=3374553 RepID=UPI003756CFF7